MRLGLSLSIAGLRGSVAAAALNATTYAVSAVTETITGTSDNTGYWPWPIDLRGTADSGIADFVLLYSTDHAADGSGGILIRFCRGDPMVAENWKGYQAAKTAGWLGSIASLPTFGGTDRIIADGYTTSGASGGSAAVNPAGFTQLETACVYRIGSTWVMTLQANNVTGYRNVQATIRATSTDLINWTLPASKGTILLNNPVTGVIGNGHTGYFRWGLNPFGTKYLNSATGLPWAYVGYSLAGGSNASSIALWGWDDPIAGTPTLIRGINNAYGRFSDGKTPSGQGFRVLSADIRTVAPLASGGYSALSYASGPNSGGGYSPGNIYEVGLDSFGTRVLSQGYEVLALSPGTARSGMLETPSAIPDVAGNRWLIFYSATNTSNLNAVGIASAPMRSPAQTSLAPLSPDIDSRTVKSWDFTVLTSLPAELSVHLRGSPIATSASSANGWVLSPKANAALSSEAVLQFTAGFDPQTDPFFDWYFDGHESTSGTGAFRDWHFGFASQLNTAFSSQTDYIVAANKTAAGAATGSIAYKRVAVAGVESLSASIDLYYGLGQASTYNAFKRSAGLRYVNQGGTRRVFFLGEGGNELDEIDVTGFNWNQRLYPIISYRTNSTTVNAFERIKRLEARY